MEKVGFLRFIYSKIASRKMYFPHSFIVRITKKSCDPLTKGGRGAYDT
jgi:hypothetical protein